MKPFDLDRSDRDLSCAIESKRRWREGMEKYVAFGAADIPVTYGVVVRGDAHPSSLLRVAHRVGVERGILPSRTTPEDSQGHDDLIPIDPRKYFRADGVQLRFLNNPTCEENERILSQMAGQIVFFGARYGTEGDTFLTPAGEIYGVEVHAASFLSYLRPLTHGSLSDFVFDFIFASGFSLAMTLLWTGYAHARRFSGGDGHRLVGVSVLETPSHVAFQVLVAVFAPSRERIRAVRGGAGIFALLFCVVSILLLFASLGVSACLLRHLGVWASPVPVFVGMLVDSLVTRWLEDSEPSEESEMSRPVPDGPWWKSLWPWTFMVWLFGDGLWRTRWTSATWVTLRRTVWLVVLCAQVYILLGYPDWLKPLAHLFGTLLHWSGRLLEYLVNWYIALISLC